MKTFYNTTSESGAALQQYRTKAHTQDDFILELFKKTGMALTPSQVWKSLFDTSRVPITSVRRSITNLTKQGLLKNTLKKRAGHFGRPEYEWQINHPPGHQLLIFENP